MINKPEPFLIPNSMSTPQRLKITILKYKPKHAIRYIQGIMQIITNYLQYEEKLLVYQYFGLPPPKRPTCNFISLWDCDPTETRDNIQTWYIIWINDSNMCLLHNYINSANDFSTMGPIAKHKLSKFVIQCLDCLDEDNEENTEKFHPLQYEVSPDGIHYEDSWHCSDCSSLRKELLVKICRDAMREPRKSRRAEARERAAYLERVNEAFR